MALSVALGMAAGASGLLSFSFLSFAALLFLLLAVLFLHKPASGFLVFGCVALVAACRFVAGAGSGSENEISRLKPQLPIEQVSLIGRIAGDVRFYAYTTGERGTWVFPVKCEGIHGADHWLRQRGRIQVRVTGAPADLEFRFGERMLLHGELSRRIFPGGEPIELTVKSSKGWKMLSGPSPFSLRGWGARLREAAARNLSVGIENYPAELAVYKALLLGYRKAIPPEINQQFARTGTMHIFAISGLHVGMVGLLLTILLKTVGIPRDRRGIWLLPLLLLYVVSTGMKASALRALTMAAVYFLAPLFRRRPDVATSIAFAAMVLLFFQPSEITSAGFIYSFTVVGFIVMAFSVVPEGWVQFGGGWWRSVWSYCASLAVTTAAAFVASLPLSALYFGSFAPVSLVSNLMVVPLTFCVVLAGWLSILVPAISEIFNFAALFFIDVMLAVTGWLAALPGAYRTVAGPPLFAMLLWYVGWIQLLVHARTPKQRGLAFIWILFAVLAVVAPLLLPG